MLRTNFVLFTAALIGLIGNNALAVTEVAISGSAGPGVSADDPSISFRLHDKTSVSGSVNYSSQIQNPPGPPINISAGAGAVAYADFGVLKAAAIGITSKAHSNSTATAYFDDTFVLYSASGLDYEGITIAPNWFLNYSGLLVNDSAVGIGYQATVGTSAGTLNMSILYSKVFNGPITSSSSVTLSTASGSTVIPLNADGLYELPALDVQFGSTVNVSGQLTVYGSTDAIKLLPDYSGYAEGGYSMDATHSAYWAGMRVSDSSGLAFTDFRAVSASGTNWNQSFVPASPVPEPSTVALILAGLGLLFVRERRPLPRGARQLNWVHASTRSPASASCGPSLGG